jgi:hypothetical protein
MIEKYLEDAFNASTEEKKYDDDTPAMLVDAGVYRVRFINKVTVVTDRNNHRNLKFGVVAFEDKNGEPVRSKIVNHRIPIEGVVDGKNGKFDKVKIFVDFFKKIVGLPKEHIQGMYEVLMLTLPDAETVAEAGFKGVDVTLHTDALAEPMKLGKVVANAEISRVQAQSGTEYNNIVKLWADK